MELTEISTPGIRARLAAWYDRNIVKGVVKAWSFIANAGAVLVGLVPDLINLVLSSWGMIDTLPTLSPEHKLILFAAANVAAMFLRVYKQKNLPQATTPVATVNVPSAVDVGVGGGKTVSVPTEIRIVEAPPPAVDHDLDEPLPFFSAPAGSRPITFGELFSYGVDHAASLVDGIPWAFTFEGHAVTHENDDVYLISDGPITHRFARGDVLWIGDGVIRVEHKWSPTP